MISLTNGLRRGAAATDRIRARLPHRALCLAAICFALSVQPQAGSASEAVDLATVVRAASGATAARDEKMDRSVVPLIAWIVEKTGLLAPEPPRITLLPREQMIKMNYGPEQISGYRNLQAFYVPMARTIYLPDTWLPGELYGRSILLHELVHHVQRSNNVRVPCPAALERQAYQLQTDWLSEQGVANPYEMIGTDEFTVRIWSSCVTDE